MQTTILARSGLPSDLDTALARYRHEIFVTRLGWDLPESVKGNERDQYDRADTVYVVMHDPGGKVCGCARLLPTTRAYLLQELFPSLLGSMPAPQTPLVWELSRFAASRSDDIGSDDWAARLLLKAVVECALGLGAHQLIGVTFLGMQRLFRRIGVHAHRVGEPQRRDGKVVIACRIEFDEQTLHALNLDSYIA